MLARCLAKNKNDDWAPPIDARRNPALEGNRLKNSCRSMDDQALSGRDKKVDDDDDDDTGTNVELLRSRAPPSTEIDSNSDSSGSVASSSVQFEPKVISSSFSSSCSSTPGELINSPEKSCVSMSLSESTHQQELFSKFQAWALKNYGESGKTKTVTRSKYRKVINILKGVEISENSKLRFWVKAKGFRLGRGTNEFNDSDREVLYIPAKDGRKYLKAVDMANVEGRILASLFMSAQNSCCLELGERSLKRVAVVEDFFQIIYNVHVEMDGRGGKHAGQKRTYRAIAETYAFLPREAVTKFLMSCADCQKRMHLSIDSLEQKFIIGRNSSIEYQAERQNGRSPNFRRSLKRFKADLESHRRLVGIPEERSAASIDCYSRSSVSTFLGSKKMKLESDNVTANYNSKKDCMAGGGLVASRSQEVGHPGRLDLLKSSACSDDNKGSSILDLPLDLSVSRQNSIQLKKELGAVPFHHDFGGGCLIENTTKAIKTSIGGGGGGGGDVHSNQICECSLETIPTKNLLPAFFSSRYFSSPFVSTTSLFFQNFCATSGYKSLPTFFPNFPSSDEASTRGNVLRTYHFEEGGHLQISQREGYGLPKFTGLRHLIGLPQIIAGYRDSATFLRRSADELECFLQRTV